MTALYREGMEMDQNPQVIESSAQRHANDPAARRHRLGRTMLGLGVAAVVLVGGGTADAALGDEERPLASSSSSSMMDGMGQMHESPAAREMHERLPADLRAQMEQMHGRMLEMMEPSRGS